ncbi:uncharacterized protein LOC115634110 [Scaptodrosophila lebanonensis]|uniref:Uncharacterized protein LOC115634110 n=1 Tax=Drosophila lebanonensis TaxID=7225 RepID=A0A6J2UGG7_DROLE|nr:uncharacterized protein LOC115634110 [Scaptodrosophila lebanonensis]
MKYYPSPDISFYVDKPSGWDHYLRYGPHHSWKLPKADLPRSKVMYYWRDIDGAKLPEIKRKDLYFDKWPKTRIRPQACLGMLYATGYRFIKLTQAPPGNFKCAPLPVNLATARVLKVELKKRKKAAAAAAKKAKQEAKEAKAGKNKAGKKKKK